MDCNVGTNKVTYNRSHLHKKNIITIEQQKGKRKEEIIIQEGRGNYQQVSHSYSQSIHIYNTANIEESTGKQH